MRISKSVLFEVLDAIRIEKEISVKHPSFDYNKYETSHIAALLEKASLVEITQLRPITIKRKSNWGRRKNDNIWRELKNKLTAGTKFYTPVNHVQNIITEWKEDEVKYFSNNSLSKN